MSYLTLKQHDKLIERVSTLTELELDIFMDELIMLLSKNNQGHLFDKHSEREELEAEIENLEAEISSLEEDVEELRDKLHKIENICDQASVVEEYEDDSFAELKSSIYRIKTIAL